MIKKKFLLEVSTLVGKALALVPTRMFLTRVENILAKLAFSSFLTLATIEFKMEMNEYVG